MKNRTRENCTSGSVRDEDGNILIYSAKCVQLRLVCSAGGRPAGAKVRRPVVWIAGWREIKILKPIDKVSLGETTSCRAVTTVNVNVASKGVDPRAEPASVGRRQHGVPKSDRCGISTLAG